MTGIQLPAALLEDGAPRAVEGLQRYFATYRGRHFDHWGVDWQDDAITSEDVVAVSFLSVNVPASAVPSLVLDPDSRVRGLLAHTSSSPAWLARGTRYVTVVPWR